MATAGRCWKTQDWSTNVPTDYYPTEEPVMTVAQVLKHQRNHGWQCCIYCHEVKLKGWPQRKQHISCCYLIWKRKEMEKLEEEKLNN